jgi:hypothetical protein
VTEYRSLKEAGTHLAAFAKAIPEVDRSTAVWGMKLAREVAIRKLRTRGIGRRLFGEGNAAAGRGKDLRGGLRILISIMKVEASAAGVKTGLQAKGLAAILEEGGRTKKHVIRARNTPHGFLKLSGGHPRFVSPRTSGAVDFGGLSKAGKASAKAKDKLFGTFRGKLSGRRGASGVVAGVEHPGSRMPGFPSIEQSMQDVLPIMARELDKRYQALGDRMVG